MFRNAVNSLALGGRLVEIAVTGQREVSFDLADFYHNESRLFGVDTLKRNLTASAQVLEALTPGFWQATIARHPSPRCAGWTRPRKPMARSRQAWPGVLCCGRRNRERP